MIRNNDANYYGNFGKINGIGTNGYNQNNINRNININNINPNLPNMMNNKDNNSFFRNSGQRKNITNNIDDNYYMYGFGNNSQSRPMNNQPVRLNQLRDFNNNADYYSNYNNQLRSDINSDNVENMGFSNQIIYNNMNSQNNMPDFFGNNNNSNSNNYNNINYYNFDSNNQIMNSKSNNNSNMNSNNNYNKNPQTVNPFINDNNGYFICNNNCKQNPQAINAFNSSNNNFNNNINNNSNFNNNNFTYNNNYNYNYNNNNNKDEIDNNQFDLDAFNKCQTEEEKKEYLGENIFKLIEEHPLAQEKNLKSDNIGKITGMILDIKDMNEIVNICQKSSKLTDYLKDALSLLKI
jgi:hypothetical protein